MARKSRNPYIKEFASMLELATFRVNVSRANKRITALERAGLNPATLVYLQNALGDTRIHIPRGKKLTQQVYFKLKALTEHFLGTKTSLVKGAREAETEHRKKFHERVKRAFSGEVAKDVEDKLFSAIGDIDIKRLLENYVYEEVLTAMQDLRDVGISPTEDLIDRALQNNIEYVVADELAARGVPTDGSTLTDYVQLAIDRGIDFAVEQYQINETDELQ